MEEKERYEIHMYDDVCVDLYDNGVLDKYINDTYKLEELLNQQSKRIKELENENQQLKQQLHDLPKKIVGEIKKELYDCGKTYLEDEPYIEICIIQGILNTILKKYGGEDE